MWGHNLEFFAAVVLDGSLTFLAAIKRQTSAIASVGRYSNATEANRKKTAYSRCGQQSDVTVSSVLAKTKCKIC